MWNLGNRKSFLLAPRRRARHEDREVGFSRNIDNDGLLRHYYVMRNSTRDVVEHNVRANHFSDPPLLVLASLADGPKHGYAMIDEIERMSGARLGPGTLYGAITRLEQQRLIEPLAVEERRQPYRLTVAGRRALRAKLLAMQQVALAGLRKLEAQ
jgi:DNA-binding PadR family transcriptional regulator